MLVTPSGMTTLVNWLSANALLPILVTLSGISTLVNCLPANASSLIVVTPSGITTFEPCSAINWSAKSPSSSASTISSLAMICTLSGKIDGSNAEREEILTVVNGLLANALPPIVVTLSGMTTLVNLLLANAATPMLVTLSGITTLVNWFL